MFTNIYFPTIELGARDEVRLMLLD